MVQLGAFEPQEQIVPNNNLNEHGQVEEIGPAHVQGDEPNIGIVNEPVNESINSSYEEESDIDTDEDNLWIDEDEEDALNLFEHAGNEDFHDEIEEQQPNCNYS